MDYHEGDCVVHQNFGVGTIAGIETRDNGSESLLYYRVSFDRTTVWVPVENQSRGGLRPLTPKSDLSRYRALLESLPNDLDNDFRKRSLELNERKDSGTYSGMCVVVRDLSARLSKKSISEHEKVLLKRTLDALVTEWSLAGGISTDQARNEIEESLKKCLQR
jgi:RNA polymerase-interacting CarD/CdnL/TRCF family regulator